MLLAAAGGGLVLLGVDPGEALGAVGTAPIVTSDAVQPAPLVDERVLQRASRSRRTAAQPEAPPRSAQPVPVTIKPLAPVLPGCDARPPDTRRTSNGRLPSSVLCALSGDAGERLRADAAVAFVRLADAYQDAFGKAICLTDGYRTLGQQQALRRLKPGLAARPGYSEHGWGLAVDLGCGVQSFRSRQHAWMAENAHRYGWDLPEWARRGGSKPEPWHWEYAPV